MGHRGLGQNINKIKPLIHYTMKNLLYYFAVTAFILCTISCSSDDDNAQRGPFELVLAENVTDAEVVSIITTGINNGMNSLVVANTTNLTTLDLPQIEALDSLRIINNAQLATVSLPNLSASVEIEITNNNELSSIDLSELAEIDNLNISGNNALENISLPALTEINNRFIIVGNDNLATISLGSLTNTTGEISISGTRITSISIPNLEEIGTIRVANAEMMTSFELPKLVTVHQRFSLSRNANLETISLPDLIECKLSFGISNHPNLTTISLPSLVEVATTRVTDGEDDGGLYINNNDLLETISVPTLEFSWIINFSGNLISTVELPMLTTSDLIRTESGLDAITTLNLSSLQDFNFIQMDAVTAEILDNILNILVNISPSITGKNISIIYTGTTPNQDAATNAQILIDNGNIVTIPNLLN